MFSCQEVIESAYTKKTTKKASKIKKKVLRNCKNVDDAGIDC